MSYAIEDVQASYMEVSFPPMYSTDEMIEDAQQIADEFKTDVKFEDDKEYLIKHKGE